ncbi:MAG: hypothetical protein D6704_10600 [Nitrospirae bacterium]|nr:MAG: hypothetical protein D6704_10600 [Nitrospirota bacterium]
MRVMRGYQSVRQDPGILRSWVLMGWLSLGLMLGGIVVDVADAKKRGRRFKPPPLKIVDIATAPMPFAPGRDPLTITVEVELPKDLVDGDILEVSSLISFPSKRSIRFLFHRQPLSVSSDSSKKTRPRTVKTTLLWDGKDQTRQFVSAGTYHYEVRAKLFSNHYDGPRTKMVSLRVRGTLEVSSPEEHLTNQAHMEHIPFVSDETSPEEVVEEEPDVSTEMRKDSLRDVTSEKPTP